MPYPYDATFAWPFPTLPVIIHQIENGAATPTLSALVDTGADITIIPAAHLQAIDADAAYTANLRSHWGASHPVSVYLVDLEIAGEYLLAIEVVADNQENDILLGRNVLNKLILLLDGPHTRTDVLNRRQADRSRVSRE